MYVLNELVLLHIIVCNFNKERGVCQYQGYGTGLVNDVSFEFLTCDVVVEPKGYVDERK